MKLFKNKTLSVLTNNGFKHFEGVAYLGKKVVWRLETKAGWWIEATVDHKIYYNDNSCKEISDFLPGDDVQTEYGTDIVTKCYSTHTKKDVYDIVGVDGINRFYGNDVLVSNCKFIIFEETLINASKLAKLQGENPIRTDGHVRWWKNIDPAKSYVVGLDPAMGTGGDYAAIQVIELPSLIQVAEWQHNRSIIEKQIKTLKDILEYIEAEGAAEIFWSIENNTLGEAGLAVIRAVGEDVFPGTMVHDPVKTSAGRNYRKGFTTTAKSKIEACSKLKAWVESERLTINSRNLVSELKTYIAHSNSYEAKQGCTDDLVASLLLIVRMVNVVATWDDSILYSISSSFERNELDRPDEEDYIRPLPIL